MPLSPLHTSQILRETVTTGEEIVTRVADLFEGIIGADRLAKGPRDTGVLNGLHTPAFFGYTGGLEYVNFDNKLQANMRFVFSGARRVIAAPVSTFVQAMVKAGKASETKSVVRLRKSFSTLSKAAVEELIGKTSDDDNPFRLYSLEHGPQTIGYVPAGWLIAETTVGNQACVGIKYAVAPKRQAFSNDATAWLVEAKYAGTLFSNSDMEGERAHEIVKISAALETLITG